MVQFFFKVFSHIMFVVAYRVAFDWAPKRIAYASYFMLVKKPRTTFSTNLKPNVAFGPFSRACHCVAAVKVIVSKST